MEIRGIKIPNKIQDWDRRSPLEKFTAKLNEMIRRVFKLVLARFRSCRPRIKVLFQKVNRQSGLRVVGKGCWKDYEVGKFYVAKKFPT